MRYWHLLHSYPLLKILYSVDVLIFIATFMTNVAIYTLLINLKASVWTISVVVSMHFVPIIILAPIIGFIVDRVCYRRLVIIALISEIVITFLFLTINSFSHIPLLMVLIFIKMTMMTLSFNSFMALLPQILPTTDLKIANELATIFWSLCFSLGMLLGGVITHAYNESTTFIFSGIIFIITFILFSIKGYPPNMMQKRQDNILIMIKQGVTYIKSTPLTKHLIFLHACVALTTFETLLTALANTSYKSVIAIPLAIGLINGVRSAGLFLGPFIIGKWVNNKRLFYILLLQGISIILWGLLQFNFYIAFIAIFFTGFCTSIIWSYTYYLLQQHTKKQYLGRIIAYNDMIFQLGCILVTLFLGFSLLYIAPSIVTIILGVGFLCFAGYYLWIQKTYHI